MTDLRVRPPRVVLLTRVVIASAAGLFVLTPLQARTQNPYDSLRPATQDPRFQDAPDAAETPDAWADEDIPAHISVVEGNATLERDTRVEAATENMPLLAGDRLRTDRGRVSILYADGSSLDVDHYSNLDLLSESLLRLNGGRIRLSVVKVTLAQPLRIDGAGSTAWIQQPGEYRVALGDPRAEFPELTLATLRGSAELVSAVGRTLVRAGNAAATTSRAAPSAPWTINVSATDEFDRWSEDLRNARFGSTSIPYIPSEMSVYSGTLDTSGTWDYEETYGHVWYPSVGVGWRPYCDGRWSFVGSFGWTWVGGPRWAYPTHHYGRWGHHAKGWYWIPHNRWSPAWVSWSQAPGYIGWAPLGYDNRPVHGFGAYRGNPHWGWTILPSQSFASRVNVRDYAVGADRLPASTWSQFGRRAPARPSMTGINETPLRAPGATSRGRAVPRGTIATPIQIGAARAAAGPAPRSSRAGTASPYSRIPAPTSVAGASGRTASGNTGARPSPPGYTVGPAAPRNDAISTATPNSGARAASPTSGRVAGYPSARPVNQSPTDDGNRGFAAARSRAGAPSAPASSGSPTRSTAPLPIMMRGTPPARPAAPAPEPDNSGVSTGRTGPDRPSAGGAAPSGYGPYSARPRGGDSPSAAPSRERVGAPASAGPSRERGGPPAAATAAPARAGAAPSGRTVSRGRGGL